MSVNIKQSNGTLKKIAGNTILLDATCAEVRSGSFSTELISADGYATVEVVFSTPMPDANYVAILNPRSGAWIKANYMVSDKTTTGFTALCSNTYAAGGMPTQIVDYYAFRLVELDGYTALQNKVNNAMGTVIEDSTNLVTSGAVYDFVEEQIANSASTFIGTAAEWAAETSKTDFNVALITDSGTVNAVDDTTGDTEVVANKHLVFKGDLSEWNSLSVAARKAFDEALISNDMDTGEVVNGVTDGDMRAVTSNAVYDALFANDVEKTFFTPTPSSGSVVAGDCWYIRKGNVVTVNIGIASMTASAPGEVIFTLPVGLRPCGQRILHTGNNNNYAAECNIQISQNGDIGVVCNSGCFGTITYVTD